MDETYSYCSMPPVAPREFPAGTAPARVVVRNAFDQWNILRKIEPDTVQGSNWDPDSIMHYPFPGREYVLRVRLYFSQGSGETAVMMW